MRSNDVETFLRERLPAELIPKAEEINFGRGMGVAIFTTDDRCVVEEHFGWKHRTRIFAGMPGTDLNEATLATFADDVRAGWDARPELTDN